MSESIVWKCERFFGKNWIYVFTLMALSQIVTTYVNVGLDERMTILEKTVAENNNKAVLMTTDGRAIKVIKTPIKAEDRKKFVISTLVNNVIVSRSSMAGENFSESNFQKMSDVLSAVQNLGLFYKEFLDDPELLKGDRSKRDEYQAALQAKGEFQSYLVWLLDAFAKDKLPEYITIRNYVDDKYTYSSNEFDTEITINVRTNNWIVSLNKYVEANAVIKIAAKGNFNLEKTTDVNPYGLRFTSFKITMPTKKS